MRLVAQCGEPLDESIDLALHQLPQSLRQPLVAGVTSETAGGTLRQTPRRVGNRGLDPRRAGPDERRRDERPRARPIS